MKFSMAKTLVLGGLVALFAGTAGAASAQGYGGPGMHHGPRAAHHRIQRLKAAYARDVAHGRYASAQKAHLKAKAIRQHVRAHRYMMHRDHGY